LAVYKASQTLPKDEVFGVTMQMRRTSIAIATRIADGCGRDSDAAFAVELKRGLAACSETEYHLLLAKDLGYLKPELHDGLSAETVEVRKMIYGLLRKL
jgi:four helix bundle protein